MNKTVLSVKEALGVCVWLRVLVLGAGQFLQKRNYRKPEEVLNNYNHAGVKARSSVCHGQLLTVNYRETLRLTLFVTS